jgi:hypothetical protein
MRTSPSPTPDTALDAVRASLLRQGAPAAYVGRLVGELADHRADVVDELVRAGATPADAAHAADERMGEPDAVADAACAALRRGSFVWRHRVLVLVILPVVLLPVMWAVVLGLGAWAAGILSPSFHPGATLPRSRALLGWACDACGHVMPAVAAVAFYGLARRRCCGRAWAWTPGVLLAGIGSVTFVATFMDAPAAATGRLVAGVAPTPDAVKLFVPLGLLSMFETWHWMRRGRGRCGGGGLPPSAGSAIGST